MEGIRNKKNSPEEAYSQLFPDDGLSKGAGAIYTLFLIVVFASIALVCFYLSMLKSKTYVAPVWQSVNQDTYNTFVANYKQNNPNSNYVPVKTDAKAGLFYIQTLQSVPLVDPVNGDANSVIASITGCLYVILSILVVFAIFWSVRGKPTYISGVSAWTLGVMWLASGATFLAFQSMVRKFFERQNVYVSTLQRYVFPGSANQSIPFAQTEITNAVVGSQLNFQQFNMLSQIFVISSMGLLGVFGIMVLAGRFSKSE